MPKKEIKIFCGGSKKVEVVQIYGQYVSMVTHICYLQSTCQETMLTSQNAVYTILTIISKCIFQMNTLQMLSKTFDQT